MCNIALFSSGIICQIFHSANIPSNYKTNLYPVISPILDNENKLYDRYGFKNHTVKEAMSEPIIDTVMIASVTSTHADLTKLSQKIRKNYNF